jgi:hypothetical protein
LVAGPEKTARIPDFFLVGAPRSGTTSMYLYLKQHPEIYTSVIKEPHFFSSDLTLPPQGVRHVEDYLALFAGAGEHQRAGEASVWYLSSRSAPAGIARFSSAARILVMLRNPVDMIHSLHSLYLRTGNEDLADPAAALDAEPERAAGRRLPAAAYFPEGLAYRAAARAAEKLVRYFDVFGRERVHVILFEDFAARPAEAYRSTLQFLGVDSSFQAELDPAAAAGKVRSLALQQLRSLPAALRAPLRNGDRTHRGGPRGPLSPALRERLEQDLAEDVSALGGLLGLDLQARWWQ